MLGFRQMVYFKRKEVAQEFNLKSSSFSLRVFYAWGKPVAFDGNLAFYNKYVLELTTQSHP